VRPTGDDIIVVDTNDPDYESALLSTSYEDEKRKILLTVSISVNLDLISRLY